MKLRLTEDGFTLVELLLVIVILGIVMGALGQAVIVGLRTSDAATNRLAESHDAQIVSSYFVTDIQSSVTVTAGAQDSTSPLPAGCTPAASPIVVFSWTDPSAGAQLVSYYRATSGGQTQLLRQACSPNATKLITVAHLLGTSTFSLTCAPTACSSTGSAATRVQLVLTAQGSDGTSYTYTLQGSRRTS